MRMGILVALMGLVACGGAVDAADHAQVIKERDALQKQVSELKTKVGKLEAMSKNQRQPPKSKGPSPEKIEAWMAEAEITKESKLEATFDTTMGKIKCTLFPDKAPLTVASFVALAEGNKEWQNPKTKEKSKAPLYNGTVFHRVIKGFMIQGGDPLGTGRGGPGYRFEDETSNGLQFDKPGLLAMANSGPNTNGSQFFITEGSPKHLNGKHTIFGECGMDTVLKIANTETNRDKPKTEVKINTVKIARK